MFAAASLDSPTLLAVFQALPGAYLLLSPDFIIEAVSESYLGETLTERDQLVGRYLFDVFPDNPQAPLAHAVRNLRASLAQVLATGQPHQMAVQHYDVPDPQQPGQFAARYWQPTNTPIRDAEGRVRHLLHSVVNVTDQQLTKLRADQLVRATLDSSKAIMQVFDAVRDAAGRVVDFRWTLVNERAATQYAADLVGQQLLALNPGVVEAGIFARFVQVLESGQPLVYEQEYRHEQYNGWFEQSVVKLGDGIVSTTTDITARKQAEAALRHSEARFRALVAQAAVGIAETEDARFTYVNERFCELTGYSREELLGKLVSDITHPDDVARDLQLLRHLYATGEPFTVDKRYVRPDGSPVWTLASVTTLRDDPSRPNRGFAACIDVTARKQAEEALRAAHARTVDILESTADAFYALDAEFRFTYINQRAAQLWGRDRAALLGRHYWTEFPAAVGSFPYQQHYQVQAEGQPAHFETVSPLVGTWIDVSIYPGSGGSLSVFFRDITARKQATQQLQVSNEQLRRVNADLDNFIYTASHDLKAPIANIEGLLLALQQELPAAAYQGEVPTVLRLMQEAIDRFGRTIGHLTDISRLQQEYDQPATRVQVAPVVHEVQLDLAPLIAQTKAQLTVAVPAQVWLTFSEKNLRSVVYNLLSNALKYRHPDRVPQVAISCQPQGAYQVLAVQDNGLGLDLTQGAEKLFAMFQRLHTHVEGTGIGLYMVKKILENAGGRIEVHSQLGHGSTFTAYLPQ